MKLQPLTPTGIQQIEHWFDHREVQARLGDRGWIHRELRLISERPGTTFRGKTVLRSYGWIGLDAVGTPVAFIGGDVYDRYIRHRGEAPSGPILSDDLGPAMGLAFAVDPERWHLGHGRAAIQAVLGNPEVADVQIFFCGIDAGNQASRHSVAAAGFTLAESEPDHEGMLFYRHDRPAATTTP